MSTFRSTYRGMKIVITESDPDRVDYHIEKGDGTVVEDTDGFDVTVEMATDVCKETIDDILDN